MRISDALAGLVGSWTGTNRLRVMPTDPWAESAATATVARVADGAFVTIAYTWADGDAPQDGLLLVGDGPTLGHAVATWVDSWHQSPEWMVLRGEVDDGGAVHLEGRYSPDALWRIHLTPAGQRWVMAMDNVMPGNDYPAVEARFG
jgi:Protein of unknown function (DUF1579)